MSPNTEKRPSMDPINVDWSEYGREKEGKREGAARVLKDARDGLRPSKALKLFHQHDTKASEGSGNMLVEFLPLKSPKYT